MKIMIKEYTPIRQFYAWVGLVTILVIVILVMSFLFSSESFNYVRAEEPVKVLVEKDMAGIVYGYNLEVEQTDDTPFITASNQWVRKGIVANNCLEFGTWVRIDDELYEVQDRMNKRYDCNTFDIWFENKAEAKEWGKQYKIISVINL